MDYIRCFCGEEFSNEKEFEDHILLLNELDLYTTMKYFSIIDLIISRAMVKRQIKFHESEKPQSDSLQQNVDH